jgi:hypothetical protein
LFLIGSRSLDVLRFAFEAIRANSVAPIAVW